jgi:hypothetical protein
MARTFYSEYVNHCIRFYARHREPTFHTDVDKRNWVACDNAFKSFSLSDRETLLNIYRDGDTVPDNIYKVSRLRKIPQDSIWKLVNELERKVAKQRGLL